MKIRELVTVWGFDIDEKPLEKLNKRIESTKESIKHILEAGAEAAASLFEMARETANAGDEALKMSQRIGIGIEKLQELQYAAKLADVDAEEFGIGMKFLSRNIFEAFKGSEQARNSFRMLGLNISDSSGHLKTGDVLLGEIADRFKNMPDGVQKTAMSIELFGRAGTKMIPFLNHGSEDMVKLGAEARKLGIVLSEGAARQGELFNDTLKTMFSMLAGLRNSIGVQLIPIITNLMQKMMGWIEANRALVQQKIKEFVASLTSLVVTLWKIFTIITPVVIGLIKHVGGLSNAFLILAAVMITITGVKLYMTMSLLFSMIVEGITYVYEIAAAFGILDAAMWPITLTVAAIVAALGLLYLVFDDVFVFFKGGDSLLGRFVNFFRKDSDQMFAIHEGLLFALGPLGWAFAAMGALARFTGPKGSRGKNAPAGNSNEVLEQPLPGKMVNLSWEKSATPSSTSNTSSTVVHQKNTINTSVHAKGDPEAIGREVAKHNERMLRQVSADLKPMQVGAR